MPQSHSNTCSCQCCTGVAKKTPNALYNAPGLGCIDYRIGRHSDFKQSMLGALSTATYPGINALTNRADDDLSIAYLDSAACVLDVLSFYQERYTNEHYLRTSQQKHSVFELAKLINYRPSPGVASTTYLSFEIQQDLSANATSVNVEIAAATKVQSLAAQNELPQIFETDETLLARPHWNAQHAQLDQFLAPSFGDAEIYLKGTDLLIQPGDAILILGSSRKTNTDSERWDLRTVQQVDIDTTAKSTRLRWSPHRGLGHSEPHKSPATSDVEVFVMRCRCSLFGHNAPAPHILFQDLLEVNTDTSGTLVTPTADSNPNPLVSNGQWRGFNLDNGLIDLAAEEPKMLVGSWVALLSNDISYGSNDLPGYLELYQIQKSSSLSRADFAISAKITRIVPDTTTNLSKFNDLRKTIVLGASEALEVAPAILEFPVTGGEISLNQHVAGLTPQQLLCAQGFRQQIQLNSDSLTMDSVQLRDQSSTALQRGDILQLTAISAINPDGSITPLTRQTLAQLTRPYEPKPLRLSVIDRDGQTGRVHCQSDDWSWFHEPGEAIAEVVQIKQVNNDRDRSAFTLRQPLQHIYQRSSVLFNFNVVRASHGESVTEILGDGSAQHANQSFNLQHLPLTYISANNPSGCAAALDITVNNLKWHPRDSLFQAASDARVYSVRHSAKGVTSIQFGDAVEGARPPSGSMNIRATYRKGLSSAANVKPNSIKTLLQNPLGVSQVNNPVAAVGGTDPEGIDKIRNRAPVSVLTLERAVSVDDYQNFARAFVGVEKAHALWLANGPHRGVFLTVAGIDGTPFANEHALLTALRHYGDPLIALTVRPYQASHFELALSVKLHPDADVSTVKTVLEQRLREHFGFAHRDFGQSVSKADIYAVVHSVKFIEAVRIRTFYATDRSASTVQDIIGAHLPLATQLSAPLPAQLLTLSPAPLDIGVFT